MYELAKINDDEERKMDEEKIAKKNKESILSSPDQFLIKEDTNTYDTIPFNFLNIIDLTLLDKQYFYLFV
jgi:hypothetical protein